MTRKIERPVKSVSDRNDSDSPATGPADPLLAKLARLSARIDTLEQEVRTRLARAGYTDDHDA